MLEKFTNYDQTVTAGKIAIANIKKNSFCLAYAAFQAVDVFGSTTRDYAEAVDYDTSTISEMVSSFRKFVAVDNWENNTDLFSATKIKSIYGNPAILETVDLFTALTWTIKEIRNFGKTKPEAVKEDAQTTGKKTVSDTLSPTAEELKEERRRDHDAMAANSLKPEKPEEEKPEEEEPEEPEETVVYVYIEYMGRKYKFTKEEMEAHCISDAE